MPNYKERKQKLRQLVKQEEQERIKKIQEQGHQFVDSDAFKRQEKFYKYYVHRQTDFSRLLDPTTLPRMVIDGAEVVKLPEPEGAYLVKNFMSVKEQLQIGYEALNHYINRPYRTNLDGTNGLYHKEEEMIEMEENEEAQIEEIKDEDGKVLYYFNEKIRMANLGYQYDWPHRSYPSTKVPIPPSITALTTKAAQLFNKLAEKEVEYRGEAVIVNYYKARDYMTGHLDDGEIDQENPIFSFCFGLSCVFLIGGPTREKQPVGVKLESGDLMIISGFSRICYHGVPRIIENSYPTPEIQQPLIHPQNNENKDMNNMNEIINYFKQHRLNINIRQVYPNK